MKQASPDSTAEIRRMGAPQNGSGCAYPPPLLALGLLGLCILNGVTGCQTPDAAAPVEQTRSPPTVLEQREPSKPAEVLTLREGDVLQISFPGAPNLDSRQQIRRDGRITLPIVGEVTAAGLTPAELEKELIRLYAPQLVSKEVAVAVVSSSYAVFVTGAVIRPGKILVDRPLTALEAVMEAGGFDMAKANMQAVVVIRNEEGLTRNYTLNLKLVLEGKQDKPFYLKPSDILYVPERFSWF